VDRPVEPVFALDLGDLLSGRALSEQGLRRAARKGPDPEEDEDREPDEDRREKQEPANDESEHFRRPPALSVRPAPYSSK
jgi:hypothetical protein